MGVLSDRFAAQLEEMKARHAESELRLEQSRQRVFETLDKLKRLSDEMVEGEG